MSPAPRSGESDEPLVRVWARRLVSIPLYACAAILVLAGLPLWASAALVADWMLGSGATLPRTRALMFAALYLACELAGLAVAAALWLTTLGGRLGGEARYRAANAALQGRWAAALLAGSIRIFSMTLEVEGDEHVRSGPLVLLVRHSSAADTVLAAVLAAHRHGLRLRYVLKRELLWDPCLDVVGRRLPNAFIARGAARTGGELAKIAGLGRGLDERSGALLYPEGTRFSPPKLERSLQRLSAAADTPPEILALAQGLRTVLPPRPGGTLALLAAAPGADVVLLEHTGFEGAATFGEFWRGALIRRTIRVRFRRFAARDIPEADRARWLYERWAEMDAWIQGHLADEGRAGGNLAPQAESGPPNRPDPFDAEQC